MVLKWLKSWKRKRILAAPISSMLEFQIAAAIPWFDSWTPSQRQKAVDDVRIFIAETNWEGCDGLALNDEIKTVIASQAAMMLTGIQGYVFDGVHTVLVYPGSFKRTMQNGLVVSDSRLAGQAWLRGPIILSWPDVAQSWLGHNVVVHELAHHLDGIDGDMSGDPIFETVNDQENWNRVASDELARLKQHLEQGQSTVLDPYGASNRAEFFAVACEAFFEIPQSLHQHHLELYDCLKKYFQADPLSWENAQR